MRDPGTSRRNPLFADAPPEDPGDAGTAGASAPGGETGSVADEWIAAVAALVPTDSAEAVVGSLVAAAPEALEHLMNAGQELLAAAKVMIDAAERGLEEHRRLRAEDHDDEPEDAPEPGAALGLRRVDLG